MTFVILTLLIQIFGNGHISYMRWKQEKKRQTQVHAIVYPNNEERTTRNPENGLELFGNNKVYNKILVDVTQVLFISIALAIVLLTNFKMKELKDKEYVTIQNSKIAPWLIFITDFAFPFMVHFVFPISFYISHPEARKFVFKRCIKSQATN